MKKYIIGDVARTLGLTTAGLHFFEREGVIEPRKGDETRRFYGMEDVIRLISYKKYRSMQLPLKEIAHQFSPEGESCSGIVEKLGAQRERLMELARQYEQMAQDVAWFEESIARADASLDVVDLAIMPQTCVLTIGADGIISPDKHQQKLAAQWLDHLPSTRLGVCSPGPGKAVFCYALPGERAVQLGLDQSPGAQMLPQSVALHTCLKLHRPYFDNPALAFETLWQQMEARGFRQNGTAMGYNLCVECTQGRRDILCEGWLPIA